MGKTTYEKGGFVATVHVRTMGQRRGSQNFAISVRTYSTTERGAGANWPAVSRAKGLNNTQYFKIWGAHGVNQQ